MCIRDRGKEAAELAVVLGEAALSESDRIFLKFSEEFERRFVNQRPDENRTIQETLDIGWSLMSLLPRSEIKRVSQENMDKYMPKDAERKVSD